MALLHCQRRESLLLWAVNVSPKLSTPNWSTSFSCRGSKGRLLAGRTDSSILGVEKIERNTPQGPQLDLLRFAKLRLA